VRTLTLDFAQVSLFILGENFFVMAKMTETAKTAATLLKTAYSSGDSTALWYAGVHLVPAIVNAIQCNDAEAAARQVREEELQVMAMDTKCG